MQTIAILSDHHAAKVAIASSIARCSDFQAVTLHINEISSMKTDEVSIAVYICVRDPDVAVIKELRRVSKALILIASIDLDSDLFMPIEAFKIQDSILGLLEQVCRLKDFLEKKIDHAPKLTDLQRNTLCSYCSCKSIDESLLELGIGRSLYFETLSELRNVLGVQENCELRQKFTASTLALISR
jgi:hypothetical protein